LDLPLAAVIAIALFFDFTNGFHDTANSIATSVSTRALSPRLAVISSAILNFIGAFFFFKVAATVAKGIVNPDVIPLKIVLAGLVGSITWNLITWYLGLPSSSSHALIGGVSGSAIAATGFGVMQWHGLYEKVLIPSLLAPVLGIAGGALIMLALIWLIRRRAPGLVNRALRLPGLDDAHRQRLGAGCGRDAAAVRRAVGDRGQHPDRLVDHDSVGRAHGSRDGGRHPRAGRGRDRRRPRRRDRGDGLPGALRRFPAAPPGGPALGPGGLHRQVSGLYT